MMTKEEAKKMMADAMLERYRGNYEGALIKLRELTDSLFGINEKWAKLLSGEAMHQFGVTHQNMKDWLVALDQLSITACYRNSIGDTIGAAYTLFQIPMCRLARGDKIEDVMPDFNRAEKAINAAIPKVVGIYDLKMLGDMYQNLAYIYQQRGDLRQAMDTYYKALAFRREVEDKRGKGLTLARMAECYKDFGDIFNAKMRAREALDIFREIEDVNRINQVEKVLREIEIE